MVREKSIGVLISHGKGVDGGDWEGVGDDSVTVCFVPEEAGRRTDVLGGRLHRAVVALKARIGDLTKDKKRGVNLDMALCGGDCLYGDGSGGEDQTQKLDEAVLKEKMGRSGKEYLELIK